MRKVAYVFMSRYNEDINYSVAITYRFLVYNCKHCAEKMEEKAMKKRIISTFLVMWGLMLLLAGSIFTVNAKAADRTDTYLKEAKFIDALKGTAEDEETKDLVIALYEKKDSNLIFFSDGFSEGYSTYTKQNVYTKEHGLVEKIIITEGFELISYEKDEIPYLETADGVIYKCRHLTDEEAQKLQTK